MYTYKASLVRTVDGDTLDALIDLGFYLQAKLRLRLLGIDTYELRDKDPIRREIAKQCKSHLDLLLCQGDFIVRTEKTCKYGRWLADIYKDGLHVNHLMMDFQNGLDSEKNDA